MKPEEFKKWAHELIDFIIDYNENIRSRNVLPSVAPGYMKDLIGEEPPENPEPWSSLASDVERCIMPGVVHWQSPQFGAFFPLGSSYPSILGEMLSAGLGTIAFGWATCPAIVELEVIMTDWLAKMMGLPQHFLTSSSGPGGAIIQSAASEVVLITLLAAKHRVAMLHKQDNPHAEEDIRTKFVAYSSEESHSCMEKAGKLCSVLTRLLPTDDRGRLRADQLEATILRDKSQGLIPIYVMTTLGSTGICSFDPLDEIGPICQKYDIWFHVDAAYAGAAFVCPEFRHYMKGIEFADSYNMNPHKWLLINFDCSVMWLKDCRKLERAFIVEREYLKEPVKFDSKYSPEFRNWEIPLGHRFRALKLWLTIRWYGAEGLRKYIRKCCDLAQRFERHVRMDHRFEVVFPANMGLVCFRLKVGDDLSKKLVEQVTKQKKLFIVGSVHKGRYLIRYAVGPRIAQESDVDEAWNVLKTNADLLLADTLDNSKTRIISMCLPDVECLIPIIQRTI